MSADGEERRSAPMPAPMGAAVGALTDYRTYGLAALVGAVGAAFMLPAGEAVFAVPAWMLVLVIMRCDIALLLIPDTASAALAGLGLLHAASDAMPDDRIFELTRALACGLVAFATLWAVQSVYRRLRGREGLGFGDVKLAGACALWLDPASAAFALELAAVSAALVLLARGRREMGAAVPFGAFLAPAAWVVFVAGHAGVPIFGELT